MASRYEFEVAVAGADALKNVNWRHGKLRPYAVIWIEPAGGGKFSTHVDNDGDTNPRWTEKLRITYASPVDDAVLYVDIIHADADGDTKPLVGSAKLPLRDVHGASGGNLERKVELHRPSGRPQGTVEIRVSVRELQLYAAALAYGVPAYGAPPPLYAAASAQCYVAPGSGYPAPPAAGYGPVPGAPPAQPVIGNAQAGGGSEAEKKKKNKFGGLGTGLAVGAVAGALGGLALMEGYDMLEDKIAHDAAKQVKEDIYEDEAAAADDDDDDY